MTIHVGEEGFADEIGEVVEHLRPDRIGHGILAAGDPELVRLLRDAGTVLEICPTSNLLTGALPDEDEVCACSARSSRAACASPSPRTAPR